ncbi:hypothetical protein EDB86DRAFT_2879223 [Lactarius hatsudake]|nr:hypothetical protein EDB86DRAFT_2879223 [Lactarius hatsudake]
MQEDLYKLAVLAKDPHKVCVTAADFFFFDQRLSIVTCDEEGAFRMTSTTHIVPSQIMSKTCYVVRNSTANQSTAPP